MRTHPNRRRWVRGPGARASGSIALSPARRASLRAGARALVAAVILVPARARTRVRTRASVRRGVIGPAVALEGAGAALERGVWPRPRPRPDRLSQSHRLSASGLDQR